MSNDVELGSNKFDNCVNNTANGLSWLTTPPGISCSPCWSAALSSSSNIFVPDSEEAICEQLGTAVVNASARERSTANTGMSVQGSTKWFAKCDKHYPSRFRQTSLATAVTNFTKPRTSHFFGLCRFVKIPLFTFGVCLKVY